MWFELHCGHSQRETKTDREEGAPTNKKKQNSYNQNQSHALQMGTLPLQDPRKIHQACAAEIPWYLWLDGQMDDHMTTCTQRATSHKCSILFSNNTLPPVSSHFGLLGSGWWPTEASLSLLQSNFGACRGHQGWGQFAVSSVALMEADPNFLNVFIVVFKQETMKPFFCIIQAFKYDRMNGGKYSPDLTDMKVDWPPPWQGVNEDGFGWLVRAENVFCLEKSILHL